MQVRQCKSYYKGLSMMILLLCFMISEVDAREVSMSYQGLQVKANLEMAPGKKLTDGVILINHGGLAHYGMELIAYLQDQFKQRGYNTLAISLSLGVSNRTGMYDCKDVHRHRHEDAVNEIEAWAQWLAKQGVSRWVLLGHSRGGGQAALFASKKNDPRLKALVLMSPQTKDNGGSGYRQRYQKPLQPILDKARALIKSGKGDEVIEHANMMFCRDISVTASSFVSYYGGDASLDSPALIPKIKIPTLIIVAENDRVVIDLDKKLTPYLKKGSGAQMMLVDGSDHFYRDLNADDAVDMIEPFLQELSF